MAAICNSVTLLSSSVLILGSLIFNKPIDIIELIYISAVLHSLLTLYFLSFRRSI